MGFYIYIVTNLHHYVPSHHNEEANLGLQYTQWIAYPNPHIFYSTGCGPSGRGRLVPPLAWQHPRPAEPPAARRRSTYRTPTMRRDTRRTIEYVCYLFAQLSVRGVSVLFSNGNSGVGEGDCVTNDSSIQFTTIFPATCTCGVCPRLANST